MQNSGFFDAELLSTGQFDRVYAASAFAKYFASFIGNGIFGGAMGELQVQAQTPNSLGVMVKSGQGWINGFWYENTDSINLSIANADTTFNRIDSVVLRYDVLSRVINLAVLKGTPSPTPEPPTLTRDNETIYELRLANVTVDANTTAITSLDVYDTKFDSNECGLVHGVIDQLDTTAFGSRLDGFIDNYIDQANIEYDTVFLSHLATLKNNGTSEYNSVFLPHLQSLKDLASQEYANFLLWLSNLKQTTESDLKAILDELNQLVEGDAFGEVISRIQSLEGVVDQTDLVNLPSQIQVLNDLQPTNEIGNILHDLNEYPAVFVYEYQSGSGVSIDESGIITGATLVSTPAKWEIIDENNVTVSTRTGIGTVDQITKINDRTFTVSFTDTNYGLYIKLGGSGGGAGQGGSKTMFEVYWSQSDKQEDNPGAIKEWTGEFVQDAATQFPDFYESLKNNHPELQTTYSDYNARIAANGSSSLYVIDRDLSGNVLNGAVRFPTLTNYVRGPRS